MMMENSRHNERLAAARKKLTPGVSTTVVHPSELSSHGTPSYSEGNQ
jgi:hypothetical protein